MFKNGMKLKSIFWSEGGELRATDTLTIEICMEAGQMAAVAWAIVHNKVKGTIHYYNLAQAEGVELENQKPDDIDSNYEQARADQQ